MKTINEKRMILMHYKRTRDLKHKSIKREVNYLSNPRNRENIRCYLYQLDIIETKIWEAKMDLEEFAD